MASPHNEIKIVKSARILGHMCTANSNTNTAINDRLNKGEAGRYKIRRSFIADKNIDNKLKINFPNSLIGTILTYSIIPFKCTCASI